MKYHYFIGQKKSPFHLSVGAVLIDKKGQVYCHHLRGMRGSMEAFLLMRETVRPRESLEQTLARGLRKEFGVRAKVRGYLGSIASSFENWEGAKIEKTTLYFLCAPIGTPKNVKRMESHEGATSVCEWQPKKFLIAQMKKQGRLLKRDDFDESKILEELKHS